MLVGGVGVLLLLYVEFFVILLFVIKIRLFIVSLIDFVLLCWWINIFWVIFWFVVIFILIFFIFILYLNWILCDFKYLIIGNIKDLYWLYLVNFKVEKFVRLLIWWMNCIR